MPDGFVGRADFLPSQKVWVRIFVSCGCQSVRPFIEGNAGHLSGTPTIKWSATLAIQLANAKEQNARCWKKKFAPMDVKLSFLS